MPCAIYRQMWSEFGQRIPGSVFIAIRVVRRDSRTQGEPRAVLRSGHFRTTVWLWSRVLHTVASFPAIRAVFRRQYEKMRIRFISWPKQVPLLANGSQNTLDAVGHRIEQLVHQLRLLHLRNIDDGLHPAPLAPSGFRMSRAAAGQQLLRT